MTALLYAGCAGALAGLALYGVVAAQDMLRRLLAVNLLGVAVFLLFIALGAGPQGVDPVAQALVLTGIVVAVSTTAVGLALIRSLRRR